MLTLTAVLQYSTDISLKSFKCAELLSRSQEGKSFQFAGNS